VTLEILVILVTLEILVILVTLEILVILVTLEILEILVTLEILVILETLVEILEILELTLTTDLPSGSFGKGSKVHEGKQRMTMMTSNTRNASQEDNGGAERKGTWIAMTEGVSCHVQERTPRKDTTGIPRMTHFNGRHRQGTMDETDRTLGSCETRKATRRCNSTTILGGRFGSSWYSPTSM
jgi:hypothetical protein